MAVYINDIELERARTAVKAIEDDALNEKRDLETDSIWKGANREIRGILINQYTCQSTLTALLQQHVGIHPSDTIIQKDF